MCCTCVCVVARRAASADEVCDRFKHSTFTCRHSPVSEGYYCVASQPWLPAAHNNTRGARGRAARLELGGRERLTDECEARRTEGVAQEQLCVCVTVRVCLEKEIRTGSKKRSRPSVTDLRPGGGKQQRGAKIPFYTLDTGLQRLNCEADGIGNGICEGFLDCLAALVSTVTTTWVQWWAL